MLSRGRVIFSRALNRRSENVIVEAIIIPELELRNVKMQVFLADIVECANDATFEDTPEALNGLSMNSADNVLVFGMIDCAVWEAKTNIPIANPLVGANQANLVRNGFIYESFQSRLLHVLNDTGNHVSLAPYSANDNRFTGGRRAGLSITLVPMPVLGFAADERFVDFNDAAQLGFWFDQCDPDFVSHQPRGFDRAKTHIAAKLTRAHSLFASQYQVSDFEPVAERLIRVLENGSGDAREAIAVHRTGAALPMKAFIGRCVVKVSVAAARAIHAIRPAAGYQISLASLFVANRKHGVELGRSKLMDWFRAFHGVSSSVGGYNHV
jgi:hypothetical protein